MANRADTATDEDWRRRKLSFSLDELRGCKDTVGSTGMRIGLRTRRDPQAFKPIVEERIKVSINPEYLEETIMIGSTLTKEGHNKLCNLLQRNLDIFTWKPADMTGVPRHIAEHHLKVREGCSPIRQNKRGQAADRNQAIHEEVGKLMEACIMKEVHYHDWLSNPVMIKKHDDSWRMCVDFKDLNKACPKDDFIVERPEEESLDTLMGVKEELPEPWILFTNGSSCIDGFGARLILTNPEGMEFTYALRFRFDTTNNEAEYKALIVGLRIAEQIEAVIPVEIGMPTLRTVEVDLVQNNEALGINLDLLEERREKTAIRGAKRKARMEKYYNFEVKNTSFKLGDLVYRNNDASHTKDTGKLGPKWEGSYEVTEALGKGAYKLRDCDGKQLSRTWNVSNLKNVIFTKCKQFSHVYSIVRVRHFNLSYLYIVISFKISIKSKA
nr:reverse transcriptase domain-containing protein [Tanacetum cinerariifolium]